MVRIITDSAADFEPAELQRMNISCVPLTVIFGQTEYQENVNLSKVQFYALLKQGDSFPKTAQAAPHILQELFDDAEKSGDEAIYITLSSQLSGTYQNADMVRRLMNCENCYVLDGRNGTGGQRMLVEHAVKLRDEGCAAKQIISAVEALRDRIVLYACIDTLEYLYRGGRISHTAYTLGSLARIKPIIRVETDGRVTVPAKAMGMRKGMDYLCKCVEDCKPDAAFPLYVMYTDDRGAAETLAARLRATGHTVPEERIIGVGAAIGSHIGPNACGLVYVGENAVQ